MSPIITFGGLLGDATDNNIAVVESLLGAAIAGVVFHLFAGQPLTIIGSTGPILIFERIAFALTVKIGGDDPWNYLEFRNLTKALFFLNFLKKTTEFFGENIAINQKSKIIDNGLVYGLLLYVFLLLHLMDLLPEF